MTAEPVIICSGGCSILHFSDIRIALLDKWVERNGPFATYHQLAKCLYEAEAIESLQVLCKELGGDLTATINPPFPTPVG